VKHPCHFKFGRGRTGFYRKARFMPAFLMMRVRILSCTTPTYHRFDVEAFQT